MRLLGLFHSVYGNEYVDLTLFDRERERNTLRSALGEEAEEWVSLFCAMPRTKFVQAVRARAPVPRDWRWKAPTARSTR